jgi:prevent-host-death family protein
MEMHNGNSSGAWTVNRARTKLDELIDQAIPEGPQFIAKKGQPVAVVVSADE